nr:dynamin family protein [Oscillospiraceae bacterium]
MPDLHTETILRQLESFSARQDEIYRELYPYSDCADLTAVRMLGENFRRKTDDFFRASRKYNLAVIGRVKAGKTSFLNTLLFEGREILPKDSMPKTAALTRIEYAERNEIEIEFYSPEDWVWLRRLSSSKEDSDRAKAARETVRAAESSGQPVSELLFGGTKLEIFKSIEEMIGRLNEFVGQNGAYTPLVKAATIRFHLEALKGISVVDTPGLNDPIPSRTERTREF